MASPNPYRLGRSLGRGGYAEVFRAEHRLEPGQLVAFKREHGQTPEGGGRLRREIQVQRVLDHPNVMPVLNADPAFEWYTMPLAEGSLQTLQEAGRLTVAPAALARAVLEQVSQGLGYAHDESYVHRDITPGNILGFPDADGPFRWVVADWGLVRRPRGKTSQPLTGGEGLGTAGFAAPETWGGDAHEVDARADVYSLGRVIAWLLTGQWPRQSIALRVEGELRGFIDECTDLDPRRRPASMEELRNRLEELTSAAPMSPRGEVQALVEAMATDTTAAQRTIELALRHRENDEIWIDELARMPLDELGNFTRDVPELAAEAAGVMLDLLEWGTWGHRDFGYINTPLRWTHEILRVLTDEGQLGLAEDVAVRSFEREKELDRWQQKRVTVAWLRSLEEPEGVVMARAIRRSRAKDYYVALLEGERILSRSLAAEFGW